MKVALYGEDFLILECLGAQRFSSGSLLWGIAKVAVYGKKSGPTGCLSPRRAGNLSHELDHCRRQVTCYGGKGGLPFMGAIFAVRIENDAIDETDRYPSMGNDEGSKLWEKNAAVLQGTTNPVDDLDSARLSPMDGYLPGGKSRAGFRCPDIKGSGFWEAFFSKGRWIWGSSQVA